MDDERDFLGSIHSVVLNVHSHTEFKFDASNSEDLNHETLTRVGMICLTQLAMIAKELGEDWEINILRYK